MIGKITTIFFALFIVGCCGLSIISTVDSKSFVELYIEAEETCITNFTLIKESRKLLQSDPSEVICPLHCLLSKLGLVNEEGLNKILVKWIRKLIELKESTFADSLDELGITLTVGINNFLDSIFHKIRTANGQLEKACTAIDKATRNQLLLTCLNDIQLAFYSQSKNQSIYIPSEENSRYLELIEDAGQKCMSNYNATVLSIMRDIKSKNMTRQNICIVVCMNSELEIINENGLNEVWVDYTRKNYNVLERGNEFEVVLDTVNQALPILSSYCSSNDNEILENDFESLKKIWLQIEQIRKKGKSEHDEDAEELLS